MFTINYNGILSNTIGDKDGITKRELEYFREQLLPAFERFLKTKENFGFCKIIKKTELEKDIENALDNIEEFDSIVVLGIGGSALGTQAISKAFGEENHRKKLYVIDNVDPFTLDEIISKLNYKSTLFLVISKSGETIETLSQFIFFYDQVVKHNLNPHKHFIFITDPKKGFLRNLANEKGFKCLDVPEDVGGRFSVLSNVGLVPSFCVGVNIKDLLSGANKIDKNSLENVFMFSLFLYLLNIRRNKKIVVMMPYCDRLIQFSAWFSQLWAESLGKKYGKNNEIIRTGQTPIIARGVTDQHSQLQLYLEGPKDKVIILLKSKDKKQIIINNPFEEYESVNFLNKKSFDELYEAEFKGTYGALLNEGIPTIIIEIEKVDMETLGGLFYFFELSTAFSGELYEINPFDQPGVELGKKIAFTLLGKKGYNEKITNDIEHREYVLTCN